MRACLPHRPEHRTLADLRVPSAPTPPSSVPARPLPAARAEAVRAAQRAFFETALAGEAQAASRAPMTAAVAATPAATPAAPVRELRPDPAGSPPTRLLRPGSLLDIRV